MERVKSARLINKLQPASLWQRGFAYIIDMIIINLVVSLPFINYFNKFDDNLSILFGSNDPDLFWISLLIVLLVLVYFVILEFKTNQTIGKMIFNIYSVSIVSKKMIFNQSLIRNLIKPFPIVLLVDVAYMLFKGDKRRLFEVFSGTMVVKKEVMIK